MSRIGKKTDDIVRRGREKRETWSPKLGGAPLRRYQWWCKETDNYRSQENFCHFWRVALIWAPLLRLRRSLTPAKLRELDGEAVFICFLLLMITCGSIAIVILIASAMWPAVGAWALLAAPALIVGVVALLVGVTFAGDKAKKAVEDYQYRKRLHAPAKVEPEQPTRVAKQRRIWPVVGRVLLWVGRPIGCAMATIWEYVVLVAQVVRVKKWKICPIVEIPAETAP